MTTPDPKRAFWTAYTAEHPDPFQFTVYDRLRPDTVAALEAGVQAVLKGAVCPHGDLAAQLAAVKAQRDYAERELNKSIDETAPLRAQLTEVLGRFFRGSAGYDARLSGVVLAREYAKAKLPLPASLKHLEGQ